MAQTNWRQLHGDFFNGARVLVTGGAGFIGSHLSDALETLGAKTIILDDLSGGDRRNVAHLKNVEFLEGTILDRAIVDRAAAGCRFIFHQAALGSVPASIERPREFFEANAGGTLNVLESARKAGVSRVMFAASSSAYGGNPVPWIETMTLLPISPYAASKVASESMLRAFSASYGLDTVSLRYFNIFGPRQNANSAYAAVIAAFAKSLFAEQRPIIYGDGEQSRDFTFVENAVHANLLAARSTQPLAGEVINVGCGKAVTVNHLAELMAKLVDRPELSPDHRPERLGDLKYSYADLGRATKLLGYNPIVDFETGLTQTVNWYRSSL